MWTFKTHRFSTRASDGLPNGVRKMCSSFGTSLKVYISCQFFRWILEHRIKITIHKNRTEKGIIARAKRSILMPYFWFNNSVVIFIPSIIFGRATLGTGPQHSNTWIEIGRKTFTKDMFVPANESVGEKKTIRFELLWVYFTREWHKFILLLSVISYV